MHSQKTPPLDTVATKPGLSSRQIGILLVIGSSSMSSLGTVFKVMGVRTINPLLAAAVGVSLAAVLLYFILRLRGRVIEYRKIPLVVLPLVILTILRPIIGNLFYSYGMAYSTAIKAMMLTKMEPYAVILWAWLIDRQRPGGMHVLLLLVHIFGAMLLSAGAALTWSDAQFGDLLILVAVLSAGLSYRFVPRVTEVLGAMQTNTLVEAFGALLTVPVILMFVPLDISPETHQGWLYIFAHVLLFNIIALSFWYESLGRIEHWLSSALRAVGPIVAAPFAWIVFGDRVDTAQICGAAIVLTTSAILCYLPARTQEQSNAA